MDDHIRPSGNALTAFFDSRGDADAAIELLRAAGVPDASVRLTQGADPRAADAPADEDPGFLTALAEFFLPSEDRRTYAEGLARGGFLVSVIDLPDDLRLTALGILDDAGAVNIDEREAAWRAEGWTGLRGDGDTPDTPDRNTSDEDAQTVAEGFADARAASVDAERPVDPARAAHPDAEPGSHVPQPGRLARRDATSSRSGVRSYLHDSPAGAQANRPDARVYFEDDPAARDILRDRT